MVANFPNSKNLNQNVPDYAQLAQALMPEYNKIFAAKGEQQADQWLTQQLTNAVNPANLQQNNNSNPVQNAGNVDITQQNQSLLSDIQKKYAEIYSVPVVKDAIDAYLSMDADMSSCLKQQDFPKVVEHINAVYQAGFDAARALSAQNDSAKSRMSSSINSAQPSGSSSRAFTRADIRAMDSDTFLKNEKAIFDQISKGLIK